ncbi:MAG: DNA internalization-related competence protein ComEC/Rec2 [Christensenellales bacterium]|jgi:competence protein ComEC
MDKDPAPRRPRVISRRPLAMVSLSYIAGIYLAWLLLPALPLWLIAIAAAFIISAFFVPRAALAFVCAAFSILGMVCFSVAANPHISQVPNEKVAISGTVTGASSISSGGYNVYCLEAAEYTSPDGQKHKLSGLVQVYSSGIIPNHGQRALINGALSMPQGPRNPGEPDYRLNLLSSGIHYTAFASGSIIYGEPAKGVLPFLIGIREALTSGLASVMPDTTAPAAAAMLFGNTGGLESTDIAAFRQSGIAHLLAVSGLHTGFLVLAASLLLRLFGAGKRLSYFITMALLIIYCGICGFAISIIRATIMAAFTLGAAALGRKNDLPTSLLFSAMLILIINPLEAASAGFQLSYGAVGGIMLLEPRLTPPLLKIRLPKYLASSISVSLAAQLGASPFQMQIFNTISPLSLFVNLIAIPASAVSALAGLFAAPLALIFRPLALPFGFICSLFTDIINSSARIAWRLPLASLSAPSPGYAAIALFFILLFITSRHININRAVRLSVCATLAALIALFIALPRLPRGLTITFLDAGQSDCAYIQTPDGRQYLIDGGGGNTRNYDDYQTAYRFLLRRGNASLNGIFVSHGDSDHIAGLIPIIDNSAPCDIIMPPYALANERPLLDLIASAKNRGFRIVGGAEGDIFDLGGGVTARVIHPGRDGSVFDSNSSSLCLLIEYYDFAALFTGDIDAETERSLIYKGISADVLKVSHHGSGYSSDAVFLNAVSPQYAVISCSISNPYGHPSDTTLDRLDNAGAKILRTDFDGAVTIRRVNGRINVSTINERP